MRRRRDWVSVGVLRVQLEFALDLPCGSFAFDAEETLALPLVGVDRDPP
jgi:hypothetical protein